MKKCFTWMQALNEFALWLFSHSHTFFFFFKNSCFDSSMFWFWTFRPFIFSVPCSSKDILNEPSCLFSLTEQKPIVILRLIRFVRFVFVLSALQRTSRNKGPSDSIQRAPCVPLIFFHWAASICSTHFSLYYYLDVRLCLFWFNY